MNTRSATAIATVKTTKSRTKTSKALSKRTLNLATGTSAVQLEAKRQRLLALVEVEKIQAELYEAQARSARLAEEKAVNEQKQCLAETNAVNTQSQRHVLENERKAVEMKSEITKLDAQRQLLEAQAQVAGAELRLSKIQTKIAKQDSIQGVARRSSVSSEREIAELESLHHQAAQVQAAQADYDVAVLKAKTKYAERAAKAELDAQESQTASLSSSVVNMARSSVDGLQQGVEAAVTDFASSSLADAMASYCNIA